MKIKIEITKLPLMTYESSKWFEEMFTQMEVKYLNFILSLKRVMLKLIHFFIIRM